MKIVFSLFLCVAILCSMGVPAQAAEDDTILGMTNEQFTASDDTELPYRLYLPRAEAPADGYAVLFLPSTH